MTTVPDPRGDTWAAAPCAGCEEKDDHIRQLEEALAASRASMKIMRSELDSLLEVLVMAGKVVMV